MTAPIIQSKPDSKWHNQLPLWIVNSIEYQTMRQGPRHTFQTIANRCDDPKRFDNGETLLVCFGGDSLIEACGCEKATFWEHVKRFIDWGWIICLSYGGGRLANVYGIPGYHDELDPYRAPPGKRCGTGRGGTWTKKDTDNLRSLLSENQTLEEGKPLVSGNRTAPVRKSDTTRPENRRQPSENRSLPSPASTDNHPNTNKGVVVADDSVQEEEALTDTQRQVMAELERCGVHGTALSQLARDPSVTVPRIRRVWSVAQTKNSPAGFLVSVLRTPDGGCEPPVEDTTKAWSKAINEGRVTVLPNGMNVNGQSARQNDGGLFLIDSDGHRKQVAEAKDGIIRKWLDQPAERV